MKKSRERISEAEDESRPLEQKKMRLANWPLTAGVLRSLGHLGETSLALLRKAGKDHRHVVTGVPASRAGDDNPAAMDFCATDRGLQFEGHFRPRSKCCRAAEFNSVFVDDDGIWRK